MNKYIVSLCLSALCGCVSAQEMKEVVRQMPDSIFPLLSKNNRLDFVDYLDSNMKAEVSNRLGGHSEMTVLTGDYTHIRMTGSSDVEMKLLPVGDTKIVCVVNTVQINDSVADSHIRFYSIDWKELTMDRYLALKGMENPDAFCRYLLNKDDNNLTLRYTFPTSLTMEGDKKIEAREVKVGWKDGWKE